MSSAQSGHRAEEAAADYLRDRGFTVVDRNWRHRRAEIDIVATKDRTAYFVEVKYRRHNGAGRGFDYVTYKKQRQMGFAMDLWLVHHRWYGPCRLAAIEVSGPTFAISGFVESIS